MVILVHTSFYQDPRPRRPSNDRANTPRIHLAGARLPRNLLPPEPDGRDVRAALPPLPSAALAATPAVGASAVEPGRSDVVLVRHAGGLYGCRRMPPCPSPSHENQRRIDRPKTPMHQRGADHGSGLRTGHRIHARSTSLTRAIRPGLLLTFLSFWLFAPLPVTSFVVMIEDCGATSGVVWNLVSQSSRNPLASKTAGPGDHTRMPRHNGFWSRCHGMGRLAVGLSRVFLRPGTP